MNRKPYKYQIGDVINQLEITNLNKSFENNGNVRKTYNYKCLVCGYNGTKTEQSFKNTGCPVCSGRIIVPEINSIATRPESFWMIQYFQGGYDEAKLYAPNSHIKIDFKCPDCGNIKNKTIHALNCDKTLGCNCNDKIPYTNKFIYQLLKILHIDFTNEKRFNWSGNKIYDIYISQYSLIIENHGEQHYYQTRRKGARTLENEQTNDKYKKELALQNGIKYYIELDCRKSELEWIKDSVINSDLPNLLHFKEEDIDWLECEVYARKNLIKEVCDMKRNNPDILVSEIAKIVKLHPTTIRRYLKFGNKLNWCNYDKVYDKNIVASNYSKTRSRRVLCIEKDMVFWGAREIKDKCFEVFGFYIDMSSVSDCCNNKIQSTHGYHFKYISDEEYKLHQNKCN